MNNKQLLFWSFHFDRAKHHNNQRATKTAKDRLSIVNLNNNRRRVELIEMKTINSFYNCDYKIILIGSKGSGKSSLIGRFFGHPFNERIKSTVGFNLMTLDLNYENDHLINVELWDTAGNFNDHHNNHDNNLTNVEFYFQNVNLIIAVFDLTNIDYTFEQCLQWIDNLKKSNLINNNIKIVIVGNKLDLQTNICDDNDSSIQTYVNSMNYYLYFTSARTLEGTEQLFEFIIKEIIDSYCRRQQRQQQITHNVQSKTSSSYIQYDDDDSSMINDNHKNNQTWLLVSIDLSVSPAKIYYDYADDDCNDTHYNDDPFNGQLNLRQSIDYDNDNDQKFKMIKSKKFKSKFKTNSMTFVLFLRKLFCLI